MSEAPHAAPALAALPRSITAGRSGFQPRYIKDRLARWVVLVGGLGVIAALLLIFVYLLTEVFPLFAGAHVEARKSYPMPGGAEATLFLAAEEQGEIGLRAAESGRITFFDLSDGAERGAVVLPVGEHKLTS